METLRERFASLMLEGLSAEASIRTALAEGASFAHDRLVAGTSASTIVRALGLHMPLERGVQQLWEFAATRWMQLPVLVLPGPSRIADVPKPDCVVSHLPTDRPPTRSDYLRAWDLCLGAEPDRSADAQMHVR